MHEVTRILSAIEQGDPQAAEQLLPLVYDELRRLAAEKMAQEKPGQTLQATALVHEAYIRLVDVEEAQHWNSRGHFFAAAAEAMRRILVERARQKNRVVHGGDRRRVELDDGSSLASAPSDDLLALDEALARLAARTRPRPPWSSCGTSRGSRWTRLPKHWGSRAQLPSAIGLMPERGFTPSSTRTKTTVRVSFLEDSLSPAGPKNRTIL